MVRVDAGAENDLVADLAGHWVRVFARWDFWRRRRPLVNKLDMFHPTGGRAEPEGGLESWPSRRRYEKILTKSPTVEKSYCRKVLRVQLTLNLS